MTKDEAVQVLCDAFACLNAEQCETLRWHAENGTRIFCGCPEVEYRYLSEDGYG
jgi:hypothetical protein